MRVIKQTTPTNDVKRQIYCVPSQSIKRLRTLDTKGITVVLKEMPAVKELKVCKKYSSRSLSFNSLSSLLVTKQCN